MIIYNLGLLNGTVLSVIHGSFAIGEVPPGQEHEGKAIIFAGGGAHIAPISRPELLNDILRMNEQVSAQRQAARESQALAQALGLGGSRVVLPTAKG